MKILTSVIIIILLALAAMLGYVAFSSKEFSKEASMRLLRLEYVFPRAFVYFDHGNPVDANASVLFGNGTLEVEFVKVSDDSVTVNYTVSLTLCDIEYFPSCFLEGVPKVIHYANSAVIAIDYRTGLARDSNGEILGKFGLLLPREILSKVEKAKESSVVSNCTKIATGTFFGKSVKVSCGRFRKFSASLIEKAPSNIRVEEVIILSHSGEVPLETTEHRLIINYVYDSKTGALLTAKIDYISDILYKLYGIRFLDFLGSKEGLYLNKIVFTS